MGKALKKFAFAVTDAGHTYDKEMHENSARHTQGVIDAEKKYGEKRPFVGMLSGNSKDARWLNEVSRNKDLYLARKHKDKENSYNPLAGLTDAEVEKARKAKLNV